MSMRPPSPAAPAAPRQPDSMHHANSTADPWEKCARIDYGGDRSFAWAVHGQVMDTTPEGRPEIEDRLLRSLALPGCTEAGRAFLCQMLALAGSAKSVPALGALVRDPNSSDAARYALQSIPGPEASAVLRDALEMVSGSAKVGLIGTIAVRGDPEACPALATVNGNPAEPELVRNAAFRALQHLVVRKS